MNDITDSLNNNNSLSLSSFFLRAQYFDKYSLTPETGGAINGFVLDSLDAAKQKIGDYLAAMPADQLAQARAQLLT